MLLHEVVQHGKRHIGTDGAGSVAQQQGGVHDLAYLTALDDKGSLHAFSHSDEMMVNGTYGQQRRYGCVACVDVAVGQNDVVHAFVD